MNRNSFLWSAIFLLAAFLLLVAVSCSNDTKASPTKAEVTVDPNIFDVDRPELFHLVPVETRDLPNVISANGSSLKLSIAGRYPTSQTFASFCQLGEG